MKTRKNDNKMKNIILCILLITLSCITSTSANAERIKDISSFEGVRDNQLIGYGLVVGLDGTGDKGKAAVQSIVNMLERMGLTLDPNEINSKNIASVIITATLPPFAKPGIKVDALISTIGDANSLQGGTLLLSPVKGPDGKVYGLAQGPVSIGGFSAGGEAASIQKNHLAAGKVPEGVTIEREAEFTLGNGSDIRLFLHKSDFATANEIAHKINTEFHGKYAFAVDSSSVQVVVPPQYEGNIVGLISSIDILNVKVDMPAKVVINERTGTIVIGYNVTISPVAIAHGSLAIVIEEEPVVSQPLPFAPRGAETVVVPRTGVSANEEDARLMQVAGITLGEVVRALNALGVTPRDLISILQALKTSGALNAELEII
jgi:flagellar P-ring protein precursor FlgI